MLPLLSPLGGHVSVTDVTFVSVSKVTARVEPTDVLAVVRPNTCLISIMLANNETGILMVKRKQSLGESLRWKCISLYFVCPAECVSLLSASPRDLPEDKISESEAPVPQDPAPHWRCSGSGEDPGRCLWTGSRLPHHSGTQGLK